jgi:ribosomal protein S12 methylthiotransferase
MHTIETLRREIPNVSIRTSLMVGFPGETEEQFLEMLEFVRKTALEQIGIFKFSLEKEAYAARLPDQISEEVKQDRFERLAAAQLKVVRKKQKQWIGRKVQAVVEGFHPESEMLLRARHSGQCPDIDGQIIINDGRNVTTFGKLYEVEITDATDYDLIGSVVGLVGCKKPRLALV